jgi:exopolysaccharide biosynthesis predicted pyruvyltransferase EpsI
MHGSEKNATLSVEEWLSLIANSSIVITDSFHGTVFSILFHREFYSIVNKARGGSRFFSLLKPLGLECRVGDVEEIETSQIQNVDWKHIDNVLQKQREDSINFLINALIK